MAELHPLPLPFYIWSPCAAKADFEFGILLPCLIYKPASLGLAYREVVTQHGHVSLQEAGHQTRALRAWDTYSKSKEESKTGSLHRKDSNKQGQDRSNKGESVAVSVAVRTLFCGVSLVHSGNKQGK